MEKGREAAKTHRQGVTWAHKHGVKICVGTDLLPSDPVDGTNATVREIELVVQCGLSPMEAIKAATSTGAELCVCLLYTSGAAHSFCGSFPYLPREHGSKCNNTALGIHQ